MPEGKKTFKERWAEASADADRARAEKAERKAEAEAEQHAGLEATCVYRGSTQPAEQLKLGARYKLRLDRDGISLRAWRQEVLGIEWGTVLDVGILDQSGTHIKTQIVRKARAGSGRLSARPRRWRRRRRDISPNARSRSTRRTATGCSPYWCPPRSCAGS
jgi:hypothetical protein